MSKFEATDVIAYQVHRENLNTEGHTINFVSMFYILFVILSFIGNVLLFCVATHKDFYPLIRPYILSLAISDFSGPIATYWMTVFSCLKRQQWQFGQSGCTFYGFVQSYCAMVSVCCICAISIERYRSMKAGVVARPKMSLVALVWIYPLFFALPPVFGWSSYGVQGFGTICWYEFIDRAWTTRTYLLYVFSLGFFLPVSITCFCYFRIFAVIHRRYRMTKQTHRLISRQCSLMSPEREDNNVETSFIQILEATNKSRSPSTISQQQIVSLKQQYRSLKTIMIVVIAFFLAWAPFVIVALIGQFGPEGLIGPYTVTVANLIAKSSTAYNPIIYGLSDSLFRKLMWHLCTKDYYQKSSKETQAETNRSERPNILLSSTV